MLKIVLEYSPDTGVLTWRERQKEMFDRGQARHSWNSRWAGKPAFRLTSSGYMRGSVLGQRLLAHRVAWAIHYGKWPDGFIDHINGVRDDNRIENLRDVSAAENSRNSSTRRDSSSGALGVVWSKARSKWMVRVGEVFIGYFDDLEEAKKARLDAASRLGYHRNHGR